MALALSNLTAGTDSGLSGYADSAVTASVTIPANGVAYISVALACNGSGNRNINSVTGASLTWTALAAERDYASRRTMRVFRAVNTGSETSGALTINVSAVVPVLEVEWSVDLATGGDTSDPDDAPVSGVATSGTSLALADVGTPDTGDGIYCAFAFESGADSFALGGAFTQLGSQTGGSNVRSLKTGYDLTATLDETPDCSWGSSGNGCGGIGFIVNAAAASGSTGTLAATESGSDTAALAGDVLIDGSLAATESGGDTAALAGDVLIEGTLAAIEDGADVAEIAGTAQQVATGTLAATESGADTAEIVAVALAQGALAANESGEDTAALTGVAPVSGTLDATEAGSDTAVIAAVALVQGSLDATESGSDTAAIEGSLAVISTGSLAATESGSDTATFAGVAPVSGALAATEAANDSAAVSGVVLVTGALDATEAGGDTAAFASSTPVTTAYPGPAGRATKGKRRRVVIRERVYEVNERDLPALLEAELLDRAPPVTAEVVEGPKPPRKRGKKAPQPVKTVEQVREAVQQIKARIEPDNAWLMQALETVAQRVLERLQDEEDSLMLLLAA